jgi:ribonuclease BN (tRNA processing enzyme)
MDFYNNWQKIVTINEYQLIGYSRGSFKTGLMISPLKIFLDAGVISQYEPNLILISHGHNDHVGELYNILIGNTRKFKVPIVSTPNMIKLIGNFLNANMSMNRGHTDKYHKWDPIGLVNKHRFNIQGKNIEIQAYLMDHSVESIGFGISEIRDKLKQEYIDKPVEELIEIKKTYKITEEKEFPLFLFCGDTGNSVLKELPLSKYPIVIIEATFLHSDHVQESKEKKHIHIQDLEPYFIKHKDIKFVLIHFSCRYDIEEIKKYQQEYQEKYENVIFFV